MNIPWAHEVRIEDRLEPKLGKAYPICMGGDGTCPPEDCGGPVGFIAHRHDLLSLEGFDDLSTMAEILGEVAQEHWRDVLDDERISELEQALERSQARERAQGRPFSRCLINARLREGEHRDLMYQNY